MLVDNIRISTSSNYGYLVNWYQHLQILHILGQYHSRSASKSLKFPRLSSTSLLSIFRHSFPLPNYSTRYECLYRNLMLDQHIIQAYL